MHVHTEIVVQQPDRYDIPADVWKSLYYLRQRCLKFGNEYLKEFLSPSIRACGSLHFRTTITKSSFHLTTLFVVNILVK